jgi:hypothetical protein
VPLASDDIVRLVQEQLASIRDPIVREGLSRVLVRPEQHLRNWDYGWPGERLACWTIAVHEPTLTSLVYSAHGFGPKAPWGLVHTNDLWFGMDSGWFMTLRDCFLDSWAAGDLPIWQVVRNPHSANAEILHTDLNSDQAFKLQDVLRRTAKGAIFAVLARPDDATSTS